MATVVVVSQFEQWKTRFEKAIAARIDDVHVKLQDRLFQRFGKTGGAGRRPSRPGQFPHMLQGHLRASIMVRRKSAYVLEIGNTYVNRTNRMQIVSSDRTIRSSRGKGWLAIPISEAARRHASNGGTAADFQGGTKLKLEIKRSRKRPGQFVMFLVSPLTRDEEKSILSESALPPARKGANLATNRKAVRHYVLVRSVRVLRRLGLRAAWELEKAWVARELTKPLNR